MCALLVQALLPALTGHQPAAASGLVGSGLVAARSPTLRMVGGRRRPPTGGACPPVRWRPARGCFV